MKHFVTRLDRQQPRKMKRSSGIKPPTGIKQTGIRQAGIKTGRHHQPRRPAPRPHLPSTPMRARRTSGKTADALDVMQLDRLARSLLAKDPHDVEALAANNPALVAEWQNAFAEQCAAAEHRARTWGSAAAVLSAAREFRAATCGEKSTH